MSIPLNIDWQQILLHLFNFAILAGGLYLLLYRPVKQFMEQRDTYYRNIHQEVESAKARAAQIEAECQQKRSEAEKDIARRKLAAEQELEQLRDRQTSAARQEAEKILCKARESARREREEIITKVSKELMDVAVTAAEKIALSGKDPYDQFLNLAERGSSREQSQ